MEPWFGEIDRMVGRRALINRIFLREGGRQLGKLEHFREGERKRGRDVDQK